MRSLTFILFVLFPLISAEYYCRQDGNFKVCRRCPDLSESCEEPLADQGCQCDHIQLYVDKNWIGGSDCRSSEGGKRWCYVNQHSKCSDKTKSKVAIHRNIWYNSGVFWSEEACIGKRNAKEIGNQLFLPGIEIISDNLTTLEGGGGFKVPSAEACQTECSERTGLCGAWSFNFDTEQCHLHSVSACCNQFGKQVKAASYMSGYICPQCWSTKNQCPCSKDLLRKDMNTKFAANGNYASFNSGTTGISAISRPCQYKRFIWKFSPRRRRWIRVKSQAFGIDDPNNKNCD